MFKYCDKVKVIKGFYEGQVGLLIRKKSFSGFISYDLDIGTSEPNIITVFEDEIEKVIILSNGATLADVLPVGDGITVLIQKEE